MNKAPHPKESPKVVWAKNEGSSDESIEYDPGRGFCCGLIHTGDSCCKNFCKIFCVCCICPLLIIIAIFFATNEDARDKAGDTLEKLTDMSCIKNFCGSYDGICGCDCIDGLLNNNFCKDCFGIGSCFSGICSWFTAICRVDCFSDMCSWIGSIGKNCGSCCASLCSMCKTLFDCSAIFSFCKGLLICNCEEIPCCDVNKGCGNPMQCLGQCPCFNCCKEVDKISCCVKGGVPRTFSSEGQGGVAVEQVTKARSEIAMVGLCCSGFLLRACFCCYTVRSDRKREKERNRQRYYGGNQACKRRGRVVSTRNFNILSCRAWILYLFLSFFL